MAYYDHHALARGDLGPWFTARFSSKCAECDRDIIAGEDQARYKYGEVVCERCGNNEEAPKETKPVICDKCFVALSSREQRAGRLTHEDCG